MTRIDRTERLAAAYDRAGAEIDRVVLALECGDKAGALAGMQRVATVMNTIGELLVDGPLLRPIPGALTGISVQLCRDGNSGILELLQTVEFTSLPQIHDKPPISASTQNIAARRANARRWQQRRRTRARHGEIVALTPVNERVIGALIELRWLDEAAATDRAAIGDAIGRMLADLAKHR